MGFTEFTESIDTASQNIADGFLYAAIVIGSAIIAAKIIEVMGVRRIFNRRKR
ncbi:uncharacterized protein METZ01_LOCUS84463 [marine metagenome]|jgi:hypothetical protein|uniref:Uncharacterized protein n=1 Tax=marine metagenome TaxID=408172 RepID=A0A381UTX9_9ZZZZ